MKNKTIDLNNHLFEVLERLNDDDLKDEELEKETIVYGTFNYHHLKKTQCIKT